MTAALNSRGKGRRAATAAGAVTLGLLALTACDKPTPFVTVTVGSSSATTEAVKGCYEDDGKLPNKEFQACLNKEAVKTLTVKAGEKVRIGVEPEIAESSWLLVVDGDPRIMEDATEATYRTFDSDVLFSQRDEMGQPAQPKKSVIISVVEANEKKTGAKGVWTFELKRKA